MNGKVKLFDKNKKLPSLGVKGKDTHLYGKRQNAFPKFRLSPSKKRMRA